MPPHVWMSVMAEMAEMAPMKPSGLMTTRPPRLRR